jgi:ATP-binding cassette, subfamily B, multidrug efflux pump
MRPAQAIHNWQMDQKADVNQPQQKPQYISAFRAMSGYIRPHLWGFTLVLCCTIIAILSDLLQPYLMKIAIDDNLMGRQKRLQRAAHHLLRLLRAIVIQLRVLVYSE